MSDSQIKSPAVWVLQEDVPKGFVTALLCVASEGAIEQSLGTNRNNSANGDEKGRIFVGTSTGFVLCYRYHIPLSFLTHESDSRQYTDTHEVEGRLHTPFKPKAMLHVERNVCPKRNAVSLLRSCLGTGHFIYSSYDRSLCAFEGQIIGVLCSHNVYFYRQEDLHPLFGSNRPSISGVSCFWFNERTGYESGVCIGKQKRLEFYHFSSLAERDGCLPYRRLELPENVEDLLWTNDTLIIAFRSHCICKDLKHSVDISLVKVENSSLGLLGSSCLHLLPHDEFMLVCGKEAKIFDFFGQPSFRHRLILPAHPTAVCITDDGGFILLEKLQQTAHLYVWNDDFVPSKKLTIAGAKFLARDNGMPFAVCCTHNTIFLLTLGWSQVMVQPSDLNGLISVSDESNVCNSLSDTSQTNVKKIPHNPGDFSRGRLLKYQERANKMITTLLSQSIEIENASSRLSEDVLSTCSTVPNEDENEVERDSECFLRMLSAQGVLTTSDRLQQAHKIVEKNELPAKGFRMIIEIAGNVGGRIGGKETLFWSMAVYCSNTGAKLTEDLHWTTDSHRLYARDLDDAYLTCTTKPIVVALQNSNALRRLLITVKRLPRSRTHASSADVQKPASRPLVGFLWACVTCGVPREYGRPFVVRMHPYSKGSSIDRNFLLTLQHQRREGKVPDWGSQLKVSFLVGMGDTKEETLCFLKELSGQLEECGLKGPKCHICVYPRECEIIKSLYEIQSVQVFLYKREESDDKTLLYTKTRTICQRWSEEDVDLEKRSLLFSEHCSIAETKSGCTFDDEICMIVEGTSVKDLVVVFSLMVSRNTCHKQERHPPFECFASLCIGQEDLRRPSEYCIPIIAGYFPDGEQDQKSIGNLKICVLVKGHHMQCADDPRIPQFGALVDLLTPTHLVSQTHNGLLGRTFVACRRLRFASTQQIASCLSDVLDYLFRFFAAFCKDDQIVHHTAEKIMAHKIDVLYLAYRRQLRNISPQSISCLVDICRSCIGKTKSIHGPTFLKSMVFALDRLFHNSTYSRECVEFFSIPKPLFAMIQAALESDQAFHSSVQLIKTVLFVLSRALRSDGVFANAYIDQEDLKICLLDIIVRICEKAVKLKCLDSAVGIVRLYMNWIPDQDWKIQLWQCLSANQCWGSFSIIVQMPEFFYCNDPVNNNSDKLFWKSRSRNFLLDLMVEELHKEWKSMKNSAPLSKPTSKHSAVKVFMAVLKHDNRTLSREVIVSYYWQFMTWLVENESKILSTHSWYTILLAECFFVILQNLEPWWLLTLERAMHAQLQDSECYGFAIFKTLLACLRALNLSSNESSSKVLTMKRQSVAVLLEDKNPDSLDIGADADILITHDTDFKQRQKTGIQRLTEYFKFRSAEKNATKVENISFQKSHKALKTLQIWTGGDSALLRRSFEKLRVHSYKAKQCRCDDVLEIAILTTLVFVEEVLAFFSFSGPSDIYASSVSRLRDIVEFCLHHSKTVRTSRFALFLIARATVTSETKFVAISHRGKKETSCAGDGLLCDEILKLLFKKMGSAQAHIQAAAAVAVSLIGVLGFQSDGYESNILKDLSIALADVAQESDAQFCDHLRNGICKVLQILEGDSTEQYLEYIPYEPISPVRPNEPISPCLNFQETFDSSYTMENAASRCSGPGNVSNNRRRIILQRVADPIIDEAEESEHPTRLFSELQEYVEAVSCLKVLGQDRTYEDEMADAIDRIIKLETLHTSLKANWLQKLKMLHLKYGRIQQAAICCMELTNLVERELVRRILSSKITKDQEANWEDALKQTNIDDLHCAIRSQRKRRHPTQQTPSFSWEYLLWCYEESSKILISAKLPLKSYWYQRRAIKILETASEWDELQRCLACAGTTASFMMSQELSFNESISPTFFRVSMCGPGFDSDDVQEYIYCALPLTQITCFQEEIHCQLRQKVGTGKVTILDNTKNIFSAFNLDKNSNLVQISSVKPLGEDYGPEFFYDLPLLVSGDIGHSSTISKQWKLRVFLKTEHSFPYRLRRQRISSKRVERLSPAVVASQDLENQSMLIQSACKLLQALATEVSTGAVDFGNKNVLSDKEASVICNELLRLLMGSLMVQVNAGPAHLIKKFLAVRGGNEVRACDDANDRCKSPTEEMSDLQAKANQDISGLHRLRSAVSNFIEICDEGVTCLIDFQRRAASSGTLGASSHTISPNILSELTHSLEQLSQVAREVRADIQKE